jgi:hypothetical protein
MKIRSGFVSNSSSSSFIVAVPKSARVVKEKVVELVKDWSESEKDPTKEKLVEELYASFCSALEELKTTGYTESIGYSATWGEDVDNVAVLTDVLDDDYFLKEVHGGADEYSNIVNILSMDPEDNRKLKNILNKMEELK